MLSNLKQQKSNLKTIVKKFWHTLPPHKWLKGPWETNPRNTSAMHCGEGNSSTWIGRENVRSHDLSLFMKSQFKSGEVNPSSTVLNVLDAKVCITKNWLLFKCESHVRDFECIVNKTAGGRSQAQILCDFTFAELSWHFITKISFSRHEPNSFEMLHSFNFTISLLQEAKMPLGGNSNLILQFYLGQ